MNDFVNQFAKQPLSVKLIILVVFLAVIGAVEYQMFYVPKKDELKSLKKKSAELNVKLVENEAIAENLPKFQEEVNILNEQLKQAVALLPNDADIQMILRQLSNTAKKTNVDLLFFKPGGQKRRGFYNEIHMTLKISGTYNDVASFIDQVGKLSRIINISDIVFSGRTTRASAIVHTVDCRATTFMFRGGR